MIRFDIDFYFDMKWKIDFDVNHFAVNLSLALFA